VAVGKQEQEQERLSTGIIAASKLGKGTILKFVVRMHGDGVVKFINECVSFIYCS
jgi:hypothetical protein